MIFALRAKRQCMAASTVARYLIDVYGFVHVNLDDAPVEMAEAYAKIQCNRTLPSNSVDQWHHMLTAINPRYRIPLLERAISSINHANLIVGNIQDHEMEYVQDWHMKILHVVNGVRRENMCDAKIASLPDHMYIHPEWNLYDQVDMLIEKYQIPCD